MLYGRDAEVSRITEVLDGARESRSAVAVIRGEAGVGKSALLENAREQASDMRVLRARGIESEAQLSRLLALGCEQWQGHYFSVPLDAAGFEKLLASDLLSERMSRKSEA